MPVGSVQRNENFGNARLNLAPSTRRLGPSTAYGLVDRVHWGTTELPELLGNLVLTLHYDAAAQVVASAEFSNVASETGRIHLEMNDEQIDPEMLSPETWRTPLTRVYGE